MAATAGKMVLIDGGGGGSSQTGGASQVQVPADVAKIVDQWVSAKQTWTAGDLLGNQTQKDNAAAQGAQARDLLRSMGQGALADQLEKANLMTALQIKSGITVAPTNNTPPPTNTKVANPAVAPTIGGTPTYTATASAPVTTGLAPAIGATGQVDTGSTGSMPQFIVIGSPPASTTPPASSLPGTGLFGDLTAGVTNMFARTVSAVDTGLQAGAGGTGAVAGGLAQTVQSLLKPLAVIVTPILALWIFGKVFRFSAKIGGGR